FFSSRRRHTRSKRDWSSDVCSSDLDPVPPSTTPSLLITLTNVPKKHFISNHKLIFLTYSPSSCAFISIGSSSLPFICAQPVKPGSTLLAPYLSRSSIKSY